jgi:hypothetical protein
VGFVVVDVGFQHYFLVCFALAKVEGFAVEAGGVYRYRRWCGFLGCFDAVYLFGCYPSRHQLAPDLLPSAVCCFM